MSQLKPKLFSTLKGYTKKQFMSDVSAGLVVAIVALPLSIALAIASGVTPEKGLHTAIIAGFIISLLGGSRVQIGGPTGAFMIIVLGIVNRFGLQGLIIATMMAGVMMILFGLFRFGSVIKFMPSPIITGFTTGIALTIFTSQIKDFFGLTIIALPDSFLGKWRAYFEAFSTTNMNTLIIGIISLSIILLWPKLNKKIPGALIALIVASFLVKLFHMDIATIGSKFGALSSTFPKPNIPSVTFDTFRELLLPALSIALLGSIESLLSAVVSDSMIHSKHNSNMELVAQGIANIFSGLFGGIPATGAIARTVTNVKNGGRTPIAGMVHAITLLIVMLLFMPLASNIPLSALAAVLIVVAYNMSEWRVFRDFFHTPKSDIIVLLTTFFITILIDLVQAIEIGVVLSSLLFMRRMINVSNISLRDLDASEESDTDQSAYRDFKAKKAYGNTLLYNISGPFFFGVADRFLETGAGIDSNTDTVIFNLTHVPSMDATALHAFDKLIHHCHKKQVTTLLVGLNPQPYKLLKSSQLIDTIGTAHIYDTLESLSQ